MSQSPLDMLREALDDHENVEDAAAAVATHAERLTVAWRAALQDVEVAVLDRHGRGLACLEALHVACFVVGAGFDHDEGPAAEAKQDSRVNALRRLWGASLEAGGECIALLRAGYAAGALARWRLLREAEVLSLMLIQHPPETAERYLEHASFHAIRFRHDYQRWATEVAEDLLGDDEMRSMGAAFGRSIARHGEEWRGDYGWAHASLVATSPQYADQVERGRRARGPTFADVEAAVGQQHNKVFYAFSSQSVHVSAAENPSGELRGFPSADEVHVVGQFVAGSLATPTAMFILSWPPEESEPEYRVFSMLLRALGEQTIRRFCDDHDSPSDV